MPNNKITEKYDIGTVHNTKMHGDIIVISILKRGKRLIRFLNEGSVRVATTNHIHSGNVSNINVPKKKIYGVGFCTNGKYNQYENGKLTRCYDVWRGILRRCYDVKHIKNNPTYEGCSVSIEWHDFQNFADWYHSNYIESFHIDKDILSNYGHLYSKDNCIFVPQEINNFFKRYRKNSTGHMCIYSEGTNGKYYVQASVFKSKKRKFIGYFDDIEDAKEALYQHKCYQIQEIKRHMKEMCLWSESLIDSIKHIKTTDDCENGRGDES